MANHELILGTQIQALWIVPSVTEPLPLDYWRFRGNLVEVGYYVSMNINILD